MAKKYTSAIQSLRIKNSTVFKQAHKVLKHELNRIFIYSLSSKQLSPLNELSSVYA